jgi:hypothetical protein
VNYILLRREVTSFLSTGWSPRRPGQRAEAFGIWKCARSQMTISRLHGTWLISENSSVFVLFCGSNICGLTEAASPLRIILPISVAAMIIAAIAFKPLELLRPSRIIGVTMLLGITIAVVGKEVLRGSLTTMASGVLVALSFTVAYGMVRFLIWLLESRE